MKGRLQKVMSSSAVLGVGESIILKGILKIMNGRLQNKCIWLGVGGSCSTF
jgi:hypothetical protein